jgi:hypothetical protein
LGQRWGRVWRPEWKKGSKWMRVARMWIRTLGLFHALGVLGRRRVRLGGLGVGLEFLPDPFDRQDQLTAGLTKGCVVKEYRVTGRVLGDTVEERVEVRIGDEAFRRLALDEAFGAERHCSVTAQ